MAGMLGKAMARRMTMKGMVLLQLLWNQKLRCHEQRFRMQHSSKSSAVAWAQT
jgi:hypothetical protein